MFDIKILGTGCPKCNKMAELVEQAANELNAEFRLEKVTDLNKIMSFGVIFTPALVLNGDVKIAGKVPKLDDIKKMLS